MIKYPAIALVLALATTEAFAAPCVKIRDGAKSTCMKFTPAEVRNAAKYGLQLGAPFELAKKTLLRQGWVIDREWLGAKSTEPPGKEELVCGAGFDALCSTAFKRDQTVLVLTLSGTNDGKPLIDVSQDE